MRAALFGAATVVLTWSSLAGATPTDGLLDACAPAVVAGAENELFKDLPKGSVGYDEAQALYDANVTKGCQASPLLFCTSCEISRAAFFVFVVRAAQLPLVNPSLQSFADVPPSHPFYKEIETAAAAGLTNGCSADEFCPDAPISRGNAALVVAKAAGLTLVTPPTPTFSDVPSSHPSYSSIEALAAACVSNGCGAGVFCPADEISRIQAAVFVARAFDLGGTNPCSGDAGSDASTADSGTTDASIGGSGGGAGAGGVWNDSGVSPSGGSGAKTGASGSTKEAEDDGCGCSVPGAPGSAAFSALASLLGALAARRRRRG